MTPLISWRRTARTMLADFRLLISFYVARSIVRRTRAAERMTAQENFRELKGLQRIEIQ
jgi:hypothetical protein